MNHFYVSASETEFETDDEILMSYVECLINKTYATKQIEEAKVNIVRINNI